MSQTNRFLEPKCKLGTLQKLSLYETRSHLYLVGCDNRERHYRVLKVHRAAAHPNATLKEIVSEDQCTYSANELKEMLDMVHQGNVASGGLRRVAKGCGLLGFVRFLHCHYIVLVTARRKVGDLGANKIYGIKATEMFAIKPETSQAQNEKTRGVSLRSLVDDVNRRLNPTQREIAEQRYLGLFQFVDLTKDFFFSYTYDLSRSQQRNVLHQQEEEAKAMYTWNTHLTTEFRAAVEAADVWCLAMTHGAFVQKKCTFFGRVLNVTLVARRSRHFAGTRYLKRGVSDRGKVANDVELEQILSEEGDLGCYSSFLQVRGSIPTFWTQETSVTMPKPPIVLNRVDPTYAASQEHFSELFRRYSAPIMVLDLTKQRERREREMIVSAEFRRAIEHLNASIFDDRAKVRYCALDFSGVSKHPEMNILSALEDAALWCLGETSIFCSLPRATIKGGVVLPLSDDTSRLEQRGVLRTNCIDCLDRTNVAQFTVGVHALGRQLAVMGLRSSTKLEAGAQVVTLLMELYSAVGDLISLQYGGSEAHKKMGASAQPPEEESNVSQLANATVGVSKHREILTSIRRYYSNAFTDRLKQDAINVFLGNFLPNDDFPPLWELDSDYYLHNFHVQTGTPLSMTCRREDWLSESGSSDSEEESDNIEEEQEDEDGSKARQRRRRRVVRRSRRLRGGLGVWWLDALRSFEDGLRTAKGAVVESTRFERAHQPYKLTSFDKIFSHDCFVPVSLAQEEMDPRDKNFHQVTRSASRRARALFASSVYEDDDDEANTSSTSLKRTSVSEVSPLPSAPSAAEERTTTARMMVGGGLFSESPSFDDTTTEVVEEKQEEVVVEVEPTDIAEEQIFPLSMPLPLKKCREEDLARVVEVLFPQQAGQEQELTVEKVFAVAERAYIGSLEQNNSSLAHAESEFYGEYARIAADPSVLSGEDTDIDASRRAARQLRSLAEMRHALRERDVDVKDVATIRDIAASAGIGRYLPRGPYRGLEQSVPAREVLAAVHEELDTLTGFTTASEERYTELLADPMLTELIRDRLKKRSLVQQHDEEQEEQEEQGEKEEEEQEQEEQEEQEEKEGEEEEEQEQEQEQEQEEGAAAASVEEVAVEVDIDAEEEEEEQRHELCAEGVVTQIAERLGALAEARQVFAAYLDPACLASARSPYSTPESVALYGSYSRPEDWLYDAQATHILREGVMGNNLLDRRHPPKEEEEEAAVAVVEEEQQPASLFSDEELAAPLSYESIADLTARSSKGGGGGRYDRKKLEGDLRFEPKNGGGLFARADNKYMLFNEPGALAAAASQMQILIPKKTSPEEQDHRPDDRDSMDGSGAGGGAALEEAGFFEEYNKDARLNIKKRGSPRASLPTANPTMRNKPPSF